MNPDISVVVPVFNEKENIQKLSAELLNALGGMKETWEIIWVDDGSTDGSNEEIKTAAAANRNIGVITLSRNFGQTAALSAGIRCASGGYIAMLDADLQNDPADIPALFAKAKEGYDVVSGWRRKRKDRFFTRVLPSLAANRIISAATGVKLHDYGCTLKIYKAGILKGLDIYGEMHRFLPALAGHMGARVTEIEVNHRPRRFGASKYGALRTFKVVLDLLTVKFMGDFITKPIYFFGGAGVVLILTSCLLACVTLYNKFHNLIFVKDQPLFLVAIFLALVGMQSLFMGLLAEILVRTYYKTGKKPAYFVKETVNPGNDRTETGKSHEK